MKRLIGAFYKIIVEKKTILDERDVQDEWQGWDAWVNIDLEQKD
ncbi:hypothetical protein [Marinomonas sp. CT5]|nr:hypothetical protein [Marinomonas sp. CT5]